MKVASLLAVALILCISFPQSIQPKRRPKLNKLCVGKDGNRYKVGEGYDDNRGIVCIHFKCVKKKKKFIMKKGKCEGKPIYQATLESSDTCDDAGCKNAFNGLGLCVDTASADWVNMSKIIDFSAGTKDGKCSSDCNCNCFKHTGCYSKKCDHYNGICLIPDQEEKRGFFIPEDYEKAFPCDKSLNCHCFIKGYDGVTRSTAAVTEPPTHSTFSSCPPTPECPTTSLSPTNPSTSPSPTSPTTSSASIYLSTSPASFYPSTSGGSSESIVSDNTSGIHGILVSARASSYLESSYHCWGLAWCRWGPEYAIDGILQTTYGKIFHSNTEDYPWLEVELNQSAKISSITISGRPDCCGDRFNNVEIRAGMTRVADGLTGQLLNINTVCGTYKGPATTGEDIHIDCASPIMAKFVTIQLKGMGATLQINEVRININEKLWRDDGRCGKNYPLPSGEPGQCDPTADENEKGPCCSPGGYCGNTDAHCKCESCVNYADSEATTTIPPTTPPTTTGIKYLGSDLPWASCSTDYDNCRIDTAVYGKNDIEIAGKTYLKGISAHAASTVQFNLDGLYEMFHACVGITNTNSQSSVRFRVSGDGRVLRDWKRKNGGEDAVCFDISLRGVKILKLEADDAGDGIGFDHSVWADAYVYHLPPSGCSSAGQRVIISNTGGSIITSPGYPETNYSAGTFCDWTFQAPPGQKISFTLLELESEFGYDVIKLYDGPGGEEQKEPILATMSGNKIHDAVISSQEEMRVTFTTDINTNMKGFKASVSAFNKEDLPKFEWLDEDNIQVTFPNDKNETIHLSLLPNEGRSCVFQGRTMNTSLTMSSSNTNSGCRSLTEDVEISIVSNNLEGKLGLFSLKNGKLQKIDITVFVSKSLNRGVRHSISKRSTGITIPKQIQIPVHFGFDRGLLIKLGRYGHGRDFIERRIGEVFGHGKLLLQGISNKITIDIFLKRDIIFINDTLHMNRQDLVKSRQFQIDEQIPLIILIDDDYANHVKGLSFRSGACRNDTEPHGVALVAWNEHSAFLGDVVYHEMGHMLGGIHDGATSEHHSGLHLGHSDFNSQNVNHWFTTAGYRCYGKTCSRPPPSPSNGSWTCDDMFANCQLICSAGYAPVISGIQCINGRWDTISSHICVPSSLSKKVYLLAGGYDRYGDLRNVEIFHPTLGTLPCLNLPAQLIESRKGHGTFIHNKTVYTCGGTGTLSTCNSFTAGSSLQKTHSLPSPIGEYLSTVVMGDKVFFVGGNGGDPSATYTTLPLSSSPTLTPVTNLTYRGMFQCVAKLGSTSFIVTGGVYHGALNRNIYKYDIADDHVTSLAGLPLPGRFDHSCIAVQESGKWWVMVTGGKMWNMNILATTQRLDIEANTWETLGDINQIRVGHAMINTDRGVMVLGGMNSGVLNSVELLVGKKWLKIEPSLATGRFYFGGAIEVEADLFSCQLGLKPGLGCPANKINTLDREDEIIIKNIPTMEECSVECEKNDTCYFWTWFNQNGGKESLDCILMSNYGSTLSDVSAVTADRNCELGCPIPPTRENGDWECNDGNTTCSLRCSAGYMSVHTQIVCSGGEWKDVARINCWKKTQPATVAGCSGDYLYDEEYPDGMVVSVPEGGTCHDLCKARQDCVAWTWTKDQDCRLQTSLGTSQTKNGSISGLQNACRPLCYLVVGKDDEATTNIQYCYESNQTTSCQDIIQTEASQFTDEDEILVCYQKGGMLCESVNFEDVDLVCNTDPCMTTLSVHQYTTNKARFTRNLGPHFKKWGKKY